MGNSGPSKAIGVGSNIAKKTQGISVNVVSKDGPFDKAPENVEKVEVNSFFQEQTVVLHLLRRFGWPLCRVAALEISSLAPLLKENNVRLVGVGLGYNSLDTFMEGNYWGDNELYVDDGKELYEALQLGQGNMKMLFNKGVIKNRNKAKELKVRGNLKGDGFQLGGTYIIDTNGKVLMEFQQEKFGDHPSKESILEALSISVPIDME